ncbi:MAG TPA: ChaN family lipoprotein [Rhodanobacteraceae bacterium]|nr:ChaN family lipoprotein [Rhodanobacteraceae bacterium]
MRGSRAQRLLMACGLACLTGGALAGGAVPEAATGWPLAWQVQGQLDHPLVGRIWQPATRTWANPQTLDQAIDAAHFVLLGETHDNPDHHRLQAQLLQRMVRAGRHPAVAFEMLDLGQQPALDAWRAHANGKAAGLGAAVGWDKTGWPSWAFYQPIAEVALAASLLIVPANLPTAEVKAVAMKGLAALGAVRVRELGLAQPLAGKWRDVMLDDLYQSHCQLMPKAALAGMVDAQRSRNAIMALRLQQDGTHDGAVLIAGAGHARNDFGVPMQLHQRDAAASVLSVALIEVQADRLKPADYAAGYGVRQLPFDYVIFTPRAERADPCVALRQRFASKAAGRSGSGSPD